MTTPGPTRRLLHGGARDPDDADLAALLRRVPARIANDGPADERVYRKLIAKRAASSRASELRLPAFAAAFSLALLAAVWIGTRPSQRAAIVRTNGQLFSSEGDRTATAAPLGTSLGVGSWLRTEHTGTAVVELARAHVQIGGDTEVELSALGQTTLLGLHRGEITLSVDPRKPGEAFAVKTARYLVTVKGTIFSVRERAENDVEVDVARGLVEVTGEGGRWQVAAGQSWQSRAPELRGANGITAAQKGQLGEPAGDTSPAPVAVVPSAPSMSPMAERRALPKPPTESAPAAPSALLVARLSPSEEPKAGKEPERPREPALQPPPAATPAAVAPLPPSAPPVPVATLKESASPFAVPEPAKVNAAGGAHPDLALYELGRTRASQGDVPGALAAFQAYGHTFPQGALAQEAAVSAVELTLQRADYSAALSEIDGFLARFPRSERVPEMHLRRGDVLRERGAGAPALAEYLVASRTGTAPIAEEGLYRAAAYAAKAGQPAQTDALLREYLRRFPRGTHAAAAAASLGEKF